MARELSRNATSGPSVMGRIRLTGAVVAVSAVLGLAGAGLEQGRQAIDGTLGSGFAEGALFWGAVALGSIGAAASLALTAFGALGRKL